MPVYCVYRHCALNLIIDFSTPNSGPSSNEFLLRYCWVNRPQNVQMKGGRLI
jgi:hypothetical protein